MTSPARVSPARGGDNPNFGVILSFFGRMTYFFFAARSLCWLALYNHGSLTAFLHVVPFLSPAVQPGNVSVGITPSLFLASAEKPG